MNSQSTVAALIAIYHKYHIYLMFGGGGNCQVKTTYFGNIFNWFSLSSKICSLVNLHPGNSHSYETLHIQLKCDRHCTAYRLC